MKFENHPLLTLSLLGRPQLRRGDVDISKTVKYRKGWALLGYLAAHADQWKTREQLADLLWPELDLPAARTNLRQVLSNLSTVLADPQGRGALRREDDVVRWESGGPVAVDLQLLSNSALATAGAADAASRQRYKTLLEPHLAAAGAMFLDGVQVANAPEFEHWLASTREFYASRSLLLLEQACRGQEQEGRLDDAIATATHLVALAPLDDGCAIRLMELLAARGRVTEAMAVFEQTRQGLQAQLGQPPSERLVACSQSLGHTRSRAMLPPEAEQAELRWVAALYCDFSRQVALDEEEDDSLRAELLLVVGRFGGRVFPTPGTGSPVVFGLMGAGERVVFRAFLSAQMLIARWGRSHGVRIGIGDGKLLYRVGAAGAQATGEVVELAMRICWAAEPGQMLLSASAAAQIGRAAVFQEARGVEGLHPLQRWIQAQTVDAVGTMDRPWAVEVPFIGRVAELAHLKAQWRQCTARQTQTVVLRAPAGYGKTRLLQELSLWVEGAGGVCLQVVCRLETQHQPLAPFYAALGQAHAPPEAVLGAKSAIFTALKSSVAQWVAQGSTLLVVDDMHWSDHASQEFLPLLAEALQGRPVMLVIASRPGFAMDYPAPADVLDLEPLPPSEALALVQACQRHTEGEPSPAVCERIVASAGGVPLFLALLVQGQQGDPHHLLSIRDVLQSELDRLGDNKTLLRLAAILGMRFSRRTLKALVPHGDVDGALAKAQALRLLELEGADVCRFHHAMIHEVVYDSAPVFMRKSWHKQVAMHLQTQQTIVCEEVAHHWGAAQCWVESAGWWNQAGDAALQREFAADAVACYQKAQRMLTNLPEGQPAPEDLQATQLRLGYALHMAEGFGSAQAWQLFNGVVQQLAAQGAAQDQHVLFAALSGCYMGGSSQGEVDGLNIARRLQEIAHTDAQHLMAAFALGNSLFWRGEFEEAALWQQRGIALSQCVSPRDRIQYCVDDPAVICRAFFAWTLWFQGDGAQASAMALETMALAGEGKRIHAQCFAATLLQAFYWCQGNVEALGALANHTYALARQYGFPLWEGVSGLFLLWVQARNGALTDAGPLFGAAQQMQQAYRAGITTSRWIAADALVVQGEWSHALALLEVSIAEAHLYEDQYCVADLLWLKGQCLAALGQGTLAAGFLQQARTSASARGAVGLVQRFLHRDAGCKVASA